MDLVVSAERIPVVGQTVSGLDFNTYPGGKGANQAVAVARLGYPVKMIGKLGTDGFGVQLRQSLMNAGVGVAAVESVAGSSGVAVIVVSSTGENSIVVVPGTNALLAPEDIDAHVDLIRSAGLVLTQLEIQTPTVERLAEVCEREGVPLMLDPAPARTLPQSILGRLTWLTPNETEAAFYASSAKSKAGDSSEDIVSSLLAAGPAGVVLKLGERGVQIADRNGLRESVPAFRVRAVDTTAAGDAFNGAIATALMLGKSAVESARFAAAAAAISVTRHGAQPSMPSFAEVMELLGHEKKSNRTDETD